MTGELLPQPAAEERRLSSVQEHHGGSVDDYLTLPYHILLVRDGEEKGKPWTASVEELPGCTSRGKSSDAALDGIEAAMAKWIEVALEEGRGIPEPKSATSHSGRLLLRMPRTLHADLTRASEREGVSLNQFITDALAAAVAWRGRTPAPPPSGSINQAPGAGGLTAEPLGQRSRRRTAGMTDAALMANFVIVAIAALVAVIVLIAAWL
jgi:predicted RNase H-like HicB family nuclease